jgi:hypothetical protein
MEQAHQVHTDKGGDEWGPVAIGVIILAAAVAAYQRLDKVTWIHKVFVTANQASQTVQVFLLHWANRFQQHPTVALHEAYSYLAPNTTTLGGQDESRRRRRMRLRWER